MIGKFPIIFKLYLEIEYNRRRHLVTRGPSSPVVLKVIVADLSKFTSEPDFRLILRIFVTLTTEPIVLKSKERQFLIVDFFGPDYPLVRVNCCVYGTLEDRDCEKEPYS